MAGYFFICLLCATTLKGVQSFDNENTPKFLIAKNHTVTTEYRKTMPIVPITTKFYGNCIRDEEKTKVSKMGPQTQSDSMILTDYNLKMNEISSNKFYDCVCMESGKCSIGCDEKMHAALKCGSVFARNSVDDSCKCPVKISSCSSHNSCRCPGNHCGCSCDKINIRSLNKFMDCFKHLYYEVQRDKYSKRYGSDGDSVVTILTPNSNGTE